MGLAFGGLMGSQSGDTEASYPGQSFRFDKPVFADSDIHMLRQSMEWVVIFSPGYFCTCSWQASQFHWGRKNRAIGRLSATLTSDKGSFICSVAQTRLDKPKPSILQSWSTGWEPKWSFAEHSYLPTDGPKPCPSPQLPVSCLIHIH